MKIILFLLFGICFSCIINRIKNYLKQFYLLYNVKDKQQKLSNEIDSRIKELDSILNTRTSDNDLELLKEKSESRAKMYQYDTLYNYKIKNISNKIVVQSIILLIALINCILCVLYI